MLNQRRFILSPFQRLAVNLVVGLVFGLVAAFALLHPYSASAASASETAAAAPPTESTPSETAATDVPKSLNSKKASKKGKKKMAAGNPIVEIETSLGTIEAELFADKAPISTQNFLKYTEEGFYDGTIFHRVINNFMIQGGGFTPEMKQKSTHGKIKNEAGNGLKNNLGTLAMARTSEVDSATAQFFINVKDNDFLNHKSDEDHEFGYAVFGKVVSGMDVVNKVKAVQTGNKGGMGDVPNTPVVIKSIKVKKT